MPNSFNQNPWHDENVSGQQAAEVQKVASPPVEVAIRTMVSDIASMAQSGGGPPRPQSVTLPSLREEKGDTSAAASERKVIPAKKGNVFGSPALTYFILAGSVVVVAVVVFFGSYYVLYPLVGRLKTPAPAAVPLQTSTSSAQTQPRFEHRSFFKQAVDEMFPLIISSSSAGFQASSQQLGQFLSGLSATSTFFEIQPQSSDGQPLTANKFFSLLNAGVLEETFLISAFNPDFTVFLYKDRNSPPNRQVALFAGQGGLWPGYILQLKATQTPLLLQSSVAKIESASSNWEDLFLQPPGTPAAGFRDALVSGQPVRVLNFSNAGSILAYGWFFNKYLIISTSLDGLKQAIQRF